MIYSYKSLIPENLTESDLTLFENFTGKTLRQRDIEAIYKGTEFKKVLHFIKKQKRLT